MTEYYDLLPTRPDPLHPSQCTVHKPSAPRAGPTDAPPVSQPPPRRYRNPDYAPYEAAHGRPRSKSPPAAKPAWDRDIIHSRTKGLQLTGTPKSKFSALTPSTFKSPTAPGKRPPAPGGGVGGPSEGVAVIGSPGKPLVQAVPHAAQPPAAADSGERLPKWAVTVVRARNIAYEAMFGLADVEAVVTLLYGKQEFATEPAPNPLAPAWQETFVADAAPDASQLVVLLEDRRVLGRAIIGRCIIHLETRWLAGGAADGVARWFPVWGDGGGIVGELRLEVAPATEALVREVEEKDRRKAAAAGAKLQPVPPLWVGLHVTVVEGKELGQAGDPAEALVRLAVGDQQFETGAVPDSQPQWNEAFTFTLEAPAVRFEVLDDSPGGRSRLGLALLALDARLGRELLAGPVELLVPVRDHGEAAGSLGIGLKAEVEGETVKALTVTVIRADDLVVPAGRETCDPLVAVSVGSQREATTAKRKTVRPAWRESFKFTVDRRQLEVEALSRRGAGAAPATPLGAGAVALDPRLDRELRVRDAVPLWVELSREGRPAGQVHLLLKGQFRAADYKEAKPEPDGSDPAHLTDYLWMHQELQDRGIEALLANYRARKRLAPLKTALTASADALDVRPWELRAQLGARLCHCEEEALEPLLHQLGTWSTVCPIDRPPYRNWFRLVSGGPYSPPLAAEEAALPCPVTALLPFEEGLLLAGTAQGYVHVWDHRRGESVSQLDSCCAPVRSILLVEGGDLLLGATDRGCHLWHLRSGHVVVPQPKKTVTISRGGASDFRSDGSSVASSLSDSSDPSNRLNLQLRHLMAGPAGLAALWDGLANRRLTKVRYHRGEVALPDHALWAYAPWSAAPAGNPRTVAEELVLVHPEAARERRARLREPLVSLDFLSGETLAGLGLQQEVFLYSASRGIALRKVRIDLPPAPPRFAIPISDRYLLASFTDGTTAVVDLREKADNVIASFSFLPVASQPICGTVLPGDKDVYLAFGLIKGFIPVFQLVLEKPVGMTTPLASLHPAATHSSVP